MKEKVCCATCKKLDTPEETSRFIRDQDANLVICEDCVQVMYEALDLKEQKKAPEFKILETPNPKKIYEHLNKHIISQDDAKRQISIAIAQHYRRIKDPSIEKANILMMGPTGTGKTEIARSIANFLQVPFVTTDATSLTTRGYVGEDADSVVANLLQSCNYNVSKAEKGIIFIDEIDKLAKVQNNSSQISTVSVQQELLKIMEGSTVKVYKGGKHRGEEILVNTKNILFICAGSFAGLDEIVENSKKENSSSIGLMPSLKAQNDIENETHQLQLFGFIPEFLGRLPIIVKTNQLSEEDFYKILVEPENSITNQYIKLLKMDRIDATFDSSFLKELAKKAIEKKLGARGIRKVLEYHLKDLFFNIEEYVDKSITISDKIELNSENVNQEKA